MQKAAYSRVKIESISSSYMKNLRFFLIRVVLVFLCRFLLLVEGYIFMITKPLWLTIVSIKTISSEELLDALYKILPNLLDTLLVFSPLTFSDGKFLLCFGELSLSFTHGVKRNTNRHGTKMMRTFF